MVKFESITRKQSFTCTNLEEVNKILNIPKKTDDGYTPVLYNGFPYKQIGHFYYVDLVKETKLNETICP